MDEIFIQLGRDLYLKGSNELPANTTPDNIISGATLASLNMVGGSIQSGKTKFNNSELGFILGLDKGVPKLYIGNTTRNLSWDGTDFVINGYVLSGKGAFGGDGSDGALALTSGTTTIDCGGARVVVKNYTSVSITGSAKLTFSNTHANGTIIIIKSQGAVTITSTAPGIEASAFGASGGTAPGAGSGAGRAGNSGSVATSTILANTGGGGGSVNVGPTGGLPGSGGVNSGFDSSTTVYGKYLRLAPGAGGGSGATYSFDSPGGGAGGAGGAAVYIECGGALNFTGSIAASGANGGAGSASGSGGGGGGGGGVVMILYNSLTANSGTITVSGGSGGTCTGGSGSYAGAGGGGGGSSIFTSGSAGSQGGGNIGGAGGGGASGYSLVALNTFFA